MHPRRPRSLLARLVALVRGALAGWIGDREGASPRAVYEDAIRERTRHYAELKRALAGILYVRNKLDGEIRALRHERARTGEELAECKRDLACHMLASRATAVAADA